MRKAKVNSRKLVYSALFLALSMILPLLTGQIPQIGKALCPMHLPVLLCGFLCGWPWGMAVGFAAPFLRFAIFSAPPMPNGIAMAFELATYGFLTGFLYRRLPKRPLGVYITLIFAMVGGRVVWGAVRFFMAGLQGSAFPVSAFLAGAVLNSVGGIVLQLVLVPLIVLALQRVTDLTDTKRTE